MRTKSSIWELLKHSRLHVSIKLDSELHFLEDLEKPRVETHQYGNGTITYTCHCKGYPTPVASWSRAPRLEKTLISRVKRNRSHSLAFHMIWTESERHLKRWKSRRGFSRKLWQFNQLSTSQQVIPGTATLTYPSLAALREEKEITFACNCINTLSSTMKIIHRVKSLLGKKRKYLKLWSQGFELHIATNSQLLIVNPILSTTEQLNEETGRNEIKPHKECTDDVCQLVRTVYIERSIEF